MEDYLKAKEKAAKMRIKKRIEMLNTPLKDKEKKKGDLLSVLQKIKLLEAKLKKDE
tara:strand:+ start:68 stop:235 length:168 start_codon:yes stop_codon:yes gene_type:complete